jgi:uncharacterized protein (TIGR03435 family)
VREFIPWRATRIQIVTTPLIGAIIIFEKRAMPDRRLVAFLIGLGIAVANTLAHAQPSAEPLQFEVATVKLVDPPMGPHAVGLRVEHGTAILQAATVRQIIVQAYAVQRVLVMGGPAWYDGDQYDILAKAPTADATPTEIRTMLQNLLADRFKLSIRRGTREVTAYSLTIGRNGSKLADPPAGQASKVVIGDRGGIVFQNTTLAGLVNTLANILDQPVIDKTGLTGRYTYNFSPSADPSGPSLFTVVEEQLGLKLEAGKAPVEVLQVDHVERPSAN